MNKPKAPQPKKETIRQERDFFQTPNYAVDLLMSFINNKHGSLRRVLEKYLLI